MSEPVSEVHLIHCQKYMATCKDKQFDLAIVDPPYGIGADKMLTGQGYAKQKKYGYKNYAVKSWDNDPPDISYFNEIKRISVNQIIWGGNYFTDKLLPARHWIIWDKLCEFTSVNAEMAWASFDRPIIIFKRHHGIDKGFLDKDGMHIHPTAKPTALYKWLLKNYAKEGDTIFDSHMGSQSSRIACYDGGFDFWGCELDEDYFRDGNKRFENFKAQLKLF